MDQRQPLKKRAVEQSSFQTYVNACNAQNQHHTQTGTAYQYVTEAKPQPIEQQNQPTIQQQPPEQIQQPIQGTPQEVQYEYYDPPLTLNAWTQTSIEDYAELLPRTASETNLLDTIDDLKETINAKDKQIEELQSSKTQLTSVEEAVPNSIIISPSDVTHEGRIYRLLTQSESNNETQIAIELREDPEPANPDISTAQEYAPMLIQIYGEKAIQSVTETPEIKPEIKKGDMYSIGPNDTRISSADFEKVPWSSPSLATRKLLILIFGRPTLATHSMTGKVSPAFKDANKPVKEGLDQNAIEDIIFIVSRKCRVSTKEVRSAITTKCADENKRLKKEQNKMLKQKQKKPGPTEPKRSALSEVNRI